MHIKFSAIINTFERETQILDLKNCFKSIFSQTHEPDEIILIHSGDEKFEKIHLVGFSIGSLIYTCEF